MLTKVGHGARLRDAGDEHGEEMWTRKGEGRQGRGRVVVGRGWIENVDGHGTKSVVTSQRGVD